MRTETLEANGIHYPINVYYERRRNTRVSLTKKSINIRVPLSISREEQQKAILQMKSWIKKKLEQRPEKSQQKIKNYQDGDRIYVNDTSFQLKITYKEKQSSSAFIREDMIYLNIASHLSEERQKEAIASLLSRCIARERLPKLKEKIHALNQQHFQQKINNIFFKNISSRWGSCSSERNLNISTRLLFAPDDILTYVCIHELAHLIEMNHSERFWQLVEKSMPEYKEKEHWLKKYGHTCAF